MTVKISEILQRTVARQFASDLEGKGSENGETDRFWIDLLQNIYGIENHTRYILYEEQVKDINTNFIDARIFSSRIQIEQKSSDKDLRVPIKQSDGSPDDSYDETSMQSLPSQLLSRIASLRIFNQNDRKRMCGRVA